MEHDCCYYYFGESCYFSASKSFISQYSNCLKRKYLEYTPFLGASTSNQEENYQIKRLSIKRLKQNFYFPSFKEKVSN